MYKYCRIRNYAQCILVCWATGEFIIDAGAKPAIIAIFIKDKGKGIPNINEIFRGEYRSQTRMGIGILLYSEIWEKAMSLSKSNELKTQFISNMSHEFKTLLNVILSLSRILLDEVDGDLTKEQEKYVCFIKQAAENLTALITDLLDLGKIEAGKVSVNI